MSASAAASVKQLIAGVVSVGIVLGGMLFSGGKYARQVDTQETSIENLRAAVEKQAELIPLVEKAVVSLDAKNDRAIEAVERVDKTLATIDAVLRETAKTQASLAATLAGIDKRVERVEAK